MSYIKGQAAIDPCCSNPSVRPVVRMFREITQPVIEEQKIGK